MFDLLHRWGLQPKAQLDLLPLFDGVNLETPHLKHFRSWKNARSQGRDFFQPFEPKWAENELSMEAFKQRVRQAKEHIANKSGSTYFLIDIKGDVIGSISLFNIRRGAAQSGSIGYWLSEEHNGKGLMGVALEFLCDHGFTKLGLARIEASSMPSNMRSINLLTKQNFLREGLCKGYLEINGTREDHLLYARTI